MMKQLLNTLKKRLAVLALLLVSVPAFAGGHGGGGGGASAPLQFIVNLTTNQFLQVVMEFEFADPEVGQHLADFKPKVQHKLILLLSDLDVPRLLTSKGKIELQERIITELNSLLHATPKTGVKEVFFTSFIVQ
jgi:flagellar FliL protein